MVKQEKKHCIECGKELKGQYKYIGINSEEGYYTESEVEATQGFFPIGLGCYKKIKSNPYFYMSNGLGKNKKEERLSSHD